MQSIKKATRNRCEWRKCRVRYKSVNPILFFFLVFALKLTENKSSVVHLDVRVWPQVLFRKTIWDVQAVVLEVPLFVCKTVAMPFSDVSLSHSATHAGKHGHVPWWRS